MLTTPPGGSYSYTLSAGQIVNGADFGNSECDSIRPCRVPPRLMRAWWTFDELAGPALDVVGPNDATLLGASTRVPGMVGRALQAIASTDFAEVTPMNAAMDFGAGAFSVDAWIKAKPGTGTRTIVDKRDGSITAARGYTLTLSGGVLGFQIGDASGHSNFLSGGPNIVDDLWHHVAATVRRTLNGGRLYVDGVPVLTFDPSARPGSVTNTGRLRMGQRQVFSSQIAFNGLIDEVELFRRALDSTEVAGIWQAGSNGKCREACYVPSVLSYASIGGTVTANASICNWSTTTQTYHWTAAGLPVGGSCTWPGPTSFAPVGGTVVAPPGACVPVVVTIGYPAGMPAWQYACWQLTVVNDTTGACFECQGRVTYNGRIYNPGGDIARLEVGHTLMVGFPIGNLTPDAIGVAYQLREVVPDDDSLDAQVVSLNGLPPGEPVTGTLTIAGGGTTTLTVDAMFEDHDEFSVHEILLEADTDGDGLYEPFGVRGLRSAPDNATAIGEETAPQSALAGLRTFPNPAGGTVGIEFRLGRAEDVRVEVLDVAGRHVRTLTAGRLAGGAQSLAWDGADDRGRPVGNGVYVVRVAAASRTLTAKVLRLW